MQKENDNIPKKARIIIGTISFIAAISAIVFARMRITHHKQNNI